jgi:hypothetical protein
MQPKLPSINYLRKGGREVAPVVINKKLNRPTVVIHLLENLSRLGIHWEDLN